MLKENVKSASRLCRFLMFWVFWECCFCPKLQAQKTMTVTDATQKVAFKNGETAQYDLYYNWKFMWIKAGMGTMSATMSYYNGQPAYRIRILSRGTHQADRFFVLRDTLTSYMTPHLLPLAYTKTDMERDKYRVRRVWFSYQGKKTILKQQYINPYGKSSWKTEESNYTVYDMASLLMRARSLDASKMSPGYSIRFYMTDGHGLEEHRLVYQGKEKIKLKNGSGVYRCLKTSFMLMEDGKEKEIVTFYVTDYDNHLPVACFLNLSFGSARIYLSGYTNLKYPMTSKVK